MASIFVKRFLGGEIETALSDARAVFVLGARQTGKSTLVRQIADATDRAVYDFDNDDTRALASQDPAGFIADLRTPAVIDEVQRAPRVLLAIKQRVDRADLPGEFLLTGSADIRTLPTVADALPGRIDYLTLHPFSQGELRERRESFLEHAFAGEPPRITGASRGKREYASVLETGGYPAAQRRLSTARRGSFFSGYLSSLLSRDLGEVSFLRDADPHRLMELVAARTSSVMNYSAIGEALAIDHKTVSRHLDVLEALQLVFALKPWSGSLTKRLVRSPKYYPNDSGLLAWLNGIDEERMVSDPNAAGALFESFAITEIRRQLSYSQVSARPFFYRDRDRHEVDLVLEHPDGRVVAVEIKATASAGPSDFRSLRFLKKRVGKKLALGVVLTTGSETLRYDDRLYALPISGLWA